MKASRTNCWLWRWENLLDACDSEAREQEPNATACQIDPEIGRGHISALAVEVICTETGKPAVLGRDEADPNDEWWLVVVD